MADILSLDETLYHLKKYREQNDKNSLNILMESHQNLAYYIACKFDNDYLDQDDLKQLGLIALYNSINMFDYNKYDIKTFSTYVSKAAMRKIRIEIRNIKRKISSNTLSLDGEINNNNSDDTFTLYNTIKNSNSKVDDFVYKKILIDELMKSFNDLSKEELQLLKLRYLNPDGCKNMRDTGKILGVSRTVVLRREKRLLKKIKENPNINKWEY